MNNEVFLRIQVIDLEDLLQNAKDDPVLSWQLEQRLHAARKALEAVKTDEAATASGTPE